MKHFDEVALPKAYSQTIQMKNASKIGTIIKPIQNSYFILVNSSEKVRNSLFMRGCLSTSIFIYPYILNLKTVKGNKKP